MIELVTSKDAQDIWTKLQEVMDRTKRQTIQIKELSDKIKKLEKELLGKLTKEDIMERERIMDKEIEEEKQ